MAENFSTSAGPAASAGALSVSELRAGMQQFLRSSGALSSLKTQLRSVIVSELLKRQGPMPMGTGPAQGATGRKGVDSTTGRQESDDESEEDTWTQRLADALIENHLRHTGRSFSLAIFSSEADVSVKSAGDDALAALLHLKASGTGVGLPSGKSLFLHVLETYLRHTGDAHGRPPSYGVETQTDSGGSEVSPAPLETRLAAVDAKYALCFARVGQSTREEVDRRMEAYRRDLQMQMDQTYQQRIRAFEQQQLLEARREAENHYKVLLQNKMEEWREMERVSVQRVESERARLAQARDDMELQRVELDRRHRELQALVEERDKAMTELENRLNDAKQQVRVLTSQTQQYEELCNVRLAEADAARNREWRRVEDIRRLQVEHLAELQLKDEEISRLRFRLKSFIGVQGSDGWYGNKEEEKGDASSVRDVLAKANKLTQQMQSSAYFHPPPSIPPPSSEVAWHSAWNSLSKVQPTSVSTPSESPRVGVAKHGEKEGVVTHTQQMTSPAVMSVPNSDLESNLLNTNKMEFAGGDNVLPVATHMGLAHSLHTVCNSTGVVPSPSSPVSNLESPRTVDETQLREGSDSSIERNEGTGMEKSSSTTRPSLVQSNRSSTVNSPRDDGTLPHSSLLSSSASGKERAIKEGATMSSGSVPLLDEWRVSLQCEETSRRIEIEEDEGTNRRGIAWSANSQRTILLQRETSNANESMEENTQGISSLDAFFTSNRQRQMVERATTNMVPMQSLSDGGNSMDDDDGDNILFRRRGSSEESF